MLDKRTYILVVCGGSSTEKEVSLRSGEAVYKALVAHGFENVELFQLSDNNVTEVISKHPDIVYLALHGKGGEDGTIQGLLELSNIRYTGPGVVSSALCMDKVLTKDMLSAHGVRTPKYLVVSKEEFDSLNAVKIASEFGMPLVVKAACQGSSIGVVIVYEEADILDAIKSVSVYGDTVFIEQFVKGTELSVPIIGNNELEVFPVVEIVSAGKFYDYDSKYTKGGSQHIIPARISPETMQNVKGEAVKAYKTMRCQGISRIDVILDDNETPYVIEINTAPGMTEQSLFPDSAAHSGVSFSDLVSKIVELALEK